MKNIFLPLLLGGVLSASACQKDQLLSPSPAPAPMMEQSVDSFMGERKESRQMTSDKETDSRLMAYTYRFTFAVPAKKLEAVSDRALKDCRNAGIQKCQIVTSSVNTYNEDNVRASIKLRVAPDWFDEYRAGLLANTNEAGGKVLNSTTNAEDLTIQISDSGAQLNALKTLRTRLLSLLEKQGSTVKDLVEVEKELARVQGQIEAGTGRLRVLKTRVSMSEVYLDYQAKSVAASRSKFSAIGSALNDFLETLSGGIAAIIYFIAFVLPWLIFILPILWLFRKWWRKRKKRKAVIKG